MDNLEFLKEKAEELKQMIDDEFDNQNYEDIINEFGIDINQLEDELRNHKPKMRLPFMKSHHLAVTPEYNYDSDSGFDLHSVEDVTIPPFGRALVPSGLCFDIKDGYEIQVRTKSGLAIAPVVGTDRAEWPARIARLRHTHGTMF